MGYKILMKNVVFLDGFLAKDPEIRETKSGNRLCSVSLCQNTEDVEGELTKDTLWVDCDFWNANADFLVRNRKKGDLVGIEGKLKYSRWDDPITKMPRTKVSVMVTQLFPEVGPQLQHGRRKDKLAEGGKKETAEEDELPF